MTILKCVVCMVYAVIVIVWMLPTGLFACTVAGKTRLIKLSILKTVHFEEGPPLHHTNTTRRKITASNPPPTLQQTD